MKKSIIIIVILQLLWIVVSAQTHYGTGAGTLGFNHSYFGYCAGNAALSSSTSIPLYPSTGCQSADT